MLFRFLFYKKRFRLIDLVVLVHANSKNDIVGEQGGLAFIADQMICIVCKNYHYDENKYTYVYEELENFSDYSVSFDSWFSYSSEY